VIKALTVGLAGVALVATLSLVAAGSLEPGQTIASDALPADEILTTVRSMGLDPIGDPLRRGPYYVLHAYDPRGIEVRVVADAQLGDILSVRPASVLNSFYTPRYQRGPRIIHVPQRGQRDERASVGDRGPRDAAGNNDEPITPATRRRITPRRLPLADGPTPIRPTPRFNAKANAMNKSIAPHDAATASTPPTSYPPPAALPRDN
jgi:hypothetical protein